MDHRENLEEQVQTSKLMTELLESEGWKHFSRHLMSRRLVLRTEILVKDDEGLNGLIECGKTKASLGELEFLLGLPSLLRDEAELEKVEISNIMKAAEEEEEDV